MTTYKNKTDKQYFKLVKHILKNGSIKSDRTGTGTKSIFGHSMVFDMKDGFPLLTSKKMFTKAIIHELLWFIKGDTNIYELVKNNVNIWNGDAYKKYIKTTNDNITIDEFKDLILKDDKFRVVWGELGPVYSKQWRNVSKSDDSNVDQLVNLINDLKNNPDSRRLMVNSWNVSELEQMTLPPCHYNFQCYTTIDKKTKKRKLSLMWSQRSVDVALGLPFNIASYAILLHLLSIECDMIPDKLIFNGGDCHLYLNHIENMKIQKKNETFELPNISINKRESIFDVTFDDIKIENYKSSDTVNFKLSN